MGDWDGLSRDLSLTSTRDKMTSRIGLDCLIFGVIFYGRSSLYELGDL